jgi:hypothetical protein
MPPVGRTQLRLHRCVSLFVSGDFVGPELLSCARQSEKRTLMPVPETAINENHGAKPGKREVGLSGQVLTVQPEAVTPRMEPPPNRNFRLGVLATDAGHHPASNRSVNNIRQ